MKVFDIFPFFSERDLLLVRLAELYEVVDHVVIVEALETFGGDKREAQLPGALAWIADTHPELVTPERVSCWVISGLTPSAETLQKLRRHNCQKELRTAGRQREIFLRNHIRKLLEQHCSPERSDYLIFSDLDEIPRASAVQKFLANPRPGIHRFKQNSYYYDVNTLVDYGHDWASRARIGTYQDLVDVGSLYAFRMAAKDTEVNVIEDGGWHFGYFGGLQRILQKTAAMSPFLVEYQLFGPEALQRDIQEGRDLHHRKCELPQQFKQIPVADDLPSYLLANLESFQHFLSNTERQVRFGGV